MEDNDMLADMYSTARAMYGHGRVQRWAELAQAVGDLDPSNKTRGKFYDVIAILETAHNNNGNLTEGICKLFYQLQKEIVGMATPEQGIELSMHVDEMVKDLLDLQPSSNP